MNDNRKVILWCGNAPNQKALANKIAQELNLVGIVIENHTSIKEKTKFGTLLGKAFDRIFFAPLYTSWSILMNQYHQKFPEWPLVPILKTDKINTQEVVDFSSKFRPDLIMVSGTRLIKKNLFSTPTSHGFINLHTGLSPYIKGGPNCTNWCIAEKKFHMIGNTVMWLDAGIDTGNIITTSCLNFSGKESITEIHVRVMESAHKLYIRAAKLILEDHPNIPAISQSSIDPGTTYYTKMWGRKQKLRFFMNLSEFRKSAANGISNTKSKELTTVPLPE
ncbi:hypothetical protein BH11BAC2_BH11BAC2_04390 [soil metagenome]